MRKFFILLALCAFAAIACRLSSVESTDTPPTAVPTPTTDFQATPVLSLTLTPTSAIGGGNPPATEQPPQGTGYILQFSQQASSGMSTLSGDILTCSGVRGPWSGELKLDFSTTQMAFAGAGPIQFSVPEGSQQAEGEIILTASGAAGNQTCILQVADPLKFEITFSQDWQSAQLIVGSTGAGAVTILCPESPPVTIPFAAFWGPEPVILPVESYGGCF